MNWEKEIIDIISKIGNKFQPNELAYLALTSKIENPLRDKIAFEFHKRHSEKYIISREWTDKSKTKKRTDLAILDINGKIECIIEFKAHSDMKGIAQWGREMKKDIKKSLLIENVKEIYFILFGNFIKALPKNQKLDCSIKYYSGLKKAIRKGFSKKDMINKWDNSLKKNNIQSSDYKLIEIDAGKFYDVDVKIITFIHGPFKK